MSTAIMALDTPELATLPKSKADQIRATFEPMAQMVAAFDDEYNVVMAAAAEEVTPAVSARARRLRLAIARVRVDAEKARKAIKEEYLLAGRAIDGTNNVLKWAISAKEDALEAIERHAEVMEAERLERLQEERAEALAPYVADAARRDLCTMEQDVWEAYLGAKKREHEDRLEAERVAEAERIERERVEALNRARSREIASVWDHFPAEHRDAPGAMDDAEFSEALAAATEAKAEHEAEQARIRAERERLEAEAKAAEAEREKERERERKRLEAERKKRAALEAADKARRDAEEAARLAQERAEAEAALAPVKARLAAWVGSFELPELPGEDHATAGVIRERFAAFRAWAIGEVDGL